MSGSVTYFLPIYFHGINRDRFTFMFCMCGREGKGMKTGKKEGSPGRCKHRWEDNSREALKG
jgi:hypothetical protein